MIIARIGASRQSVRGRLFVREMLRTGALHRIDGAEDGDRPHRLKVRIYIGDVADELFATNARRRVRRRWPVILRKTS
jgi:hypothetical protein